MKHFLLISSIGLTSVLSAQTWAFCTLDINQVKAGVNSNGDLFWRYNLPSFYQPAFEVPVDSGTHTIFAAAAWVGGLDSSGALHLGAQTYRQSGNDFYPGPVMNSAFYTPAMDSTWNKVWKINKTTIDSFLAWYANPSAYPQYTIPSSVTSWPGNGASHFTQANQLAPYVDINGDGIYDPNSGDYPCIKGDQAIFFLFNDDRLHGETGGAKLTVEIHGMLYGYLAPGTWLDSTVFVNYKVYNRSSNTYSNMYWGQWTDWDIGMYDDDYVGTDVGRHIAYAYNGDDDDGSSPQPYPGTYGANPPAQGVVFLRGPEADPGDGIDNDRDFTVDEPSEVCRLTHTMYYNNDFTIMGNPMVAPEFYNYMQGQWFDSTHLTYGGNGYGGTTVYDFMYPNTTGPVAYDSNQVPLPPWNEASALNLPHDRRGVGSTGPFTLLSGQSTCIDIAYVFGRGNNGPQSGIRAMQNATDSAYAFYLNNSPCTCGDHVTNIGHNEPVTVGIYPNPANESVNIICGDNSAGSQIEIVDVNGKIVKTANVLSGNSVVVNTEDLAAGVYFVRVNKGSVVLTGRFIRN